MNAAQRLWALPFFRFAVVGTGGFVVDTVVLYAAIMFGLDRYLARVPSYICAATFTWLGNRTITFADARATAGRGIAAEWLRFMVTNLSGGAVNLAVYWLLITVSATVNACPILGVAAGALSGMTVNFFASRWLVFTGDRSG